MPIDKTLEKVERDIASGDLGKARDRLHGLIASYPENVALRRKLGDVYWRLQYPAMAGRYWYLEEHKTPDMTDACAAFERSCGNNPFQILLALKFRGDIDKLNRAFAGHTLLELQRTVRERYGYNVDFQKRGGNRFKPRVPKLRWRERALVAGCVVLLFALLGLIGVGIQTGLKAIF